MLGGPTFWPLAKLKKSHVQFFWIFIPEKGRLRTDIPKRLDRKSWNDVFRTLHQTLSAQKFLFWIIQFGAKDTTRRPQKKDCFWDGMNLIRWVYCTWDFSGTKLKIFKQKILSVTFFVRNPKKNIFRFSVEPFGMLVPKRPLSGMKIR